MRIKGKVVMDVAIERDPFGRFSVTESHCQLCDMPHSLEVRVTFDEDWDETKLCNICDDCLIDQGLFVDHNDLNMRG